MQALEAIEYLVSYGQAGEFGRFRSEPALACERGERVVIRSPRGLEIGQILRPATDRHAQHLPNSTVGQLLRQATPADDQAMERLKQKGLEILQHASELSEQLHLPTLWVDAEMLLDGEHVVLHHLGCGGADLRTLVSTLARELNLHVMVQDLSDQATVDAGESDLDDSAGCGREGCGKGNCSSGGCSTCTASSVGTRDNSSVDFAALRQEMETRRTRLL